VTRERDGPSRLRGGTGRPTPDPGAGAALEIKLHAGGEDLDVLVVAELELEGPVEGVESQSVLPVGVEIRGGR
jgi:hypothetical protein